MSFGRCGQSGAIAIVHIFRADRRARARTYDEGKEPLSENYETLVKKAAVT